MRGGGEGQDSPGFHPEDDGVCLPHSTLRDDIFHTRARQRAATLSHIPTEKRSAELPPPGKTTGKPFSKPDEGRLRLSESRSKALLTLSGGRGKGVVPGVLSFDGSAPTSVTRDKMDCWVSPAGV